MGVYSSNRELHNRFIIQDHIFCSYFLSLCDSWEGLVITRIYLLCCSCFLLVFISTIQTNRGLYIMFVIKSYKELLCYATLYKNIKDNILCSKVIVTWKNYKPLVKWLEHYWDKITNSLNINGFSYSFSRYFDFTFHQDRMASFCWICYHPPLSAYC